MAISYTGRKFDKKANMHYVNLIYENRICYK